MTYEEKKNLLIEALQVEKYRFAKMGQDVTDHDITIQYLKLGHTTFDPENWDLLDAAINDFEYLCSDYGVI